MQPIASLTRQLYKIVLMIGVIMVSVLVINFAMAAAKQIGVVSFILGGPDDIQVQHADQTSWEPVKFKMPILDGDLLKSKAESRCEVKLHDGTVIRIGEKTTFHFTEVNISKKLREAKTEMHAGQVWVNLPKDKSSKNTFQIKAPTAVCAVRGTIYRVDADSTTKCVVYDGAVNVGPVTFWGRSMPRTPSGVEPYPVPGPTQISGPYEVSLEQWQQIVKGYQIVVRQDGKFAKDKVDEEKDAALDWVRWNKEKDAQLSR
ncbi:FecR domain-containing protein [candidate division KSB1 bacterium]|nr:FecR domain-containing protein [candidate division KSB1 bacterium]